MTALVIISVVLAMAVKLYLVFRSQIESVSHTQHFTLEDTKLSTQDFYVLTEGIVKERLIPSLELSRVYHKMGGVLSAKREYLRITYKEYFFDVCAAPFAKDFFVSWRQGNLRQVQFGRRNYKTFYEQDTELMFKESMHLCLNRAIKMVTEGKGMRVLQEGEVPQLN